MAFTLPHRPLSLDDVVAELFAPQAFAEPCYCDICNGAEKLRGAPCGSCGEPMWGCAGLSCVCGLLARIRARHRPAILATRIQSLWRGYKTRKDIQEKNDAEVAVIEDHWRHYDEKYRTYVICQNLVVALKKNDPSYDVTQTIYYRWMLEEGGPWIAEAEDFMLQRGWVRPKSTKLNMGVLSILFEGILKHCDLTDEEQQIALALMDSFTAALEA
jgi:hypothetical protein